MNQTGLLLISRLCSINNVSKLKAVFQPKEKMKLQFFLKNLLTL